jgi:hypothetical protein
MCRWTVIGALVGALVLGGWGVGTAAAWDVPRHHPGGYGGHFVPPRGGYYHHRPVYPHGHGAYYARPGVTLYVAPPVVVPWYEYPVVVRPVPGRAVIVIR